MKNASYTERSTDFDGEHRPYEGYLPAESGFDLRWLFGRGLIYGSPVLAGLVTVSYIAFMERYAPIGPFPSYGIVIVINAVLGAIGAAGGVILLTGRTGIRVAGAIAYAVLSLFLYGGTCGLGAFLVAM